MFDQVVLEGLPATADSDHDVLAAEHSDEDDFVVD